MERKQIRPTPQLLLLLLLHILAMPIGTKCEEACKNYQTCKNPYVIVFDAGSTGTQLFVYKFERDNSLADKVKLVSESKSKKIKPGLDSFAFSTQRIQGYLKPLIDFAKNAIPAVAHNETMMFLGSTAGVRVLPFGQKHNIVRATATALKLSPFRYRYQQLVMPGVMPGHAWSCLGSQPNSVTELRAGNLAMVLTGQAEALFGLVAVNFLMKAYDGRAMIRYYGMLDMGGGSTQVALHEFNRSSSVRNPSTAWDMLSHVWTRSYLGLGKEAATLEILGYDRNSRQRAYKSPCLSEKFSGNFSFADVSITVSGGPVPGGRSRLSVCEEKAKALIRKFNVVEVPSREDWRIDMALSSYFYVSDGLNKSGHLPIKIPNILTIDHFYKAVVSVCENPPTTGRYAPYLCIDSIYIHTLLRYGYKFAEDHVLYITDMLPMGKPVGTPTWSLGLAFIYVTDHRYLTSPAFASGYLEGRQATDPAAEI